jgi:deoxyribodipyrimidine photo-lyase
MVRVNSRVAPAGARVPDARIRHLNPNAARPNGRYVLYWMTSARRLEYNFALQRAVEACREFSKPLVILEAVRCDYPYASDRLHRFVLDGMAEHRTALAGSPVEYLAYVEPSRGAGKGMLAALAADATLVVTDWYPAFFLPRMLTAAARHVPAGMEAVDSNGILPIAAAGRAFANARGMRAFLQRTLRDHLVEFPQVTPLSALPRVRRATVAPSVNRRWPAAGSRVLSGATLASLPIDHEVRPVELRGGATAARARLKLFLSTGLPRYADDHNQPDRDATSRLSPWIHFGHLSVHEVFAAVARRERWTTRKIPPTARGAREGWWNTSPSAEAFFDELITWRELAFNTCEFVDGFDRYESLPSWAQRTLDRHRRDRRPYRYSIEAFDQAETHDPLWNAIQRQLRGDGWFHGYMRMLWGKKILEWSRKPEDALEIMAHLMNRYSLDGRDPNSWAGFGWVLGRYDRPWPEREIFGTVRYMSSANTARKLMVRQYLREYGPSVNLTRGVSNHNR